MMVDLEKQMIALRESYKSLGVEEVRRVMVTYINASETPEIREARKLICHAFFYGKGDLSVPDTTNWGEEDGFVHENHNPRR